ncbi:MAG TPA: glycosyltransferase [Candidatus Angelobacter sp.]|jgi:glycosyltransferase involved in cell wall biosynthesis
MANILYVAYPLLTVTEESAGGAEQVLWTLEREMACRGAHTTVAASAGSRVSGELFATGEPCVERDDYDRRRIEHEDRVVAFVQEREREREGMPFDLIHDMSGSFWRRAAEIDTPVLATLHLPRSFYPEGVFDNVPEDVSFNCVSDSQARSFANLDAMAGVVPNGIALDRFDLPERAARKSSARNRLLWLGRICEEKAPHVALEIAARAGIPITIAGQVYPFSYHQEYFDREVVPGLKSMSDAEFVSSPSGRVKRRLLHEAKALLITSLAQETSSLVAMEAAASGAPVIAFKHGALPDVVRDGVTGFIVDDAEHAVEASKHVEDISSASCVQHAQANFNAAKMAERYTDFYARLMRAEKALQFTSE